MCRSRVPSRAASSYERSRTQGPLPVAPDRASTPFPREKTRRQNDSAQAPRWGAGGASARALRPQDGAARTLRRGARVGSWPRAREKRGVSADRVGVSLASSGLSSLEAVLNAWRLRLQAGALRSRAARRAPRSTHPGASALRAGSAAVLQPEPGGFQHRGARTRQLWPR